MQEKLKIHLKIEREITFWGKIERREWKGEWQIYVKRMIIRRNKIKEDKGKVEEGYILR